MTADKSMLRDLCLGVLASGFVLASCAQAEELATASSLPASVKTATAPSTNGSTQDLYMVCAFYPKPDTCESVYRKAMDDNSITAEAVKAEYKGYARYLSGNATLNDADRQYLKDNGISVPNDLSAANQAGLHNVISDPSLTANEKRVAVNNFLSRAVEAELYCGFNSCEENNQRMAAGT
jgi:hypothetical protein